MSSKLQHYLNPLHIYCRLRDMGITKRIALLICRTYERVIFRPFLSETIDSGRKVWEQDRMCPSAFGNAENSTIRVGHRTLI